MWVGSIPSADAAPPSARAHLGAGLLGSEMIFITKGSAVREEVSAADTAAPAGLPGGSPGGSRGQGAPRSHSQVPACSAVSFRVGFPPSFGKLLYHTPHLPSECVCVSFFSFRENNTEQSLTFKNAMIFCHRYENLSAAYLILRCIEYQNKRY